MAEYRKSVTRIALTPAVNSEASSNFGVQTALSIVTVTREDFHNIQQASSEGHSDRSICGTPP